MQIIAGEFKQRKIITPKGMATRPTTSRLRESLFNICQNYIEGAAFLDLFAGSGAMGLEALSRGAASATFVDNDRDSIHCIKKNVQTLGIEAKAKIMQGDVFVLLPRLVQMKMQYDIIYADPPYGQFDMNHFIAQLDENELLKAGGFLFIEDESDQVVEGIALKVASVRNMGRSSLIQYRKQCR